MVHSFKQDNSWVYFPDDEKHLYKSVTFGKLFNKSKFKISYCCMSNSNKLIGKLNNNLKNASYFYQQDIISVRKILHSGLHWTKIFFASFTTWLASRLNFPLFLCNSFQILKIFFLEILILFGVVHNHHAAIRNHLP